MCSPITLGLRRIRAQHQTLTLSPKSCAGPLRDRVFLRKLTKFGILALKEMVTLCSDQNPKFSHFFSKTHLSPKEPAQAWGGVSVELAPFLKILSKPAISCLAKRIQQNSPKKSDSGKNRDSKSNPEFVGDTLFPLYVRQQRRPATSRGPSWSTAHDRDARTISTVPNI